LHRKNSDDVYEAGALTHGAGADPAADPGPGARRSCITVPAGNSTSWPFPSTFLYIVRDAPTIESATPTGLDIRVESPEKALPAILESANRLDCQLEFIEYHRPRLDDVFIAHTGRRIQDETPNAAE